VCLAEASHNQLKQIQVPDVSNLPIEEILDIRRRREPELKAFRDQLSALAAQIDPELAGAALAMEIDSKIQTDVKPALNDVRKSIRELQTAAYKKLINPVDHLSTTLITFGISSMAGVSTPTQYAAVAALIAKLFDFTAGKAIDKKMAMSSNPWSVLFYMNER
jgi:hypothetical protein